MADHDSMIKLFQAAAANKLGRTDLQILRMTNDLFRDAAVVAGEATFKEGDKLTRQTIAQAQLDEFAKKQITAIVYSDGRRQPIASYAEMAGRTMSGHTAIQGSLSRYGQYGFDLFLISSHFQACPLCEPHEGRIYSQSGHSDKYPPLADAIAQGLFHPSCNHNLVPYYEGMPLPETRLDPEHQRLVDKHGQKEAQRIAYQAQQRQREIERNIRYWKNREAVALTKDVKAKTHQKVLDWQSAQRSHINNNTFLRRDYSREQTGKAL